MGCHRNPDFLRTHRHDSPFSQETTLLGCVADAPCGVALLALRVGQLRAILVFQRPVLDESVGDRKRVSVDEKSR